MTTIHRGPIPPLRTVDTMACATCGTANSLLAQRCLSCGAYLRDRIASLNLFSTLYQLIEQPAEAFLRIARSEQKNYTYLLFAAAGPSFMYPVLLIGLFGDKLHPFDDLFGALYLLGPLYGILVGLSTGYLLRFLVRRIHSLPMTFRLSAVLSAYAQFPLVVVSVVVLPVTLGIFGSALFTSNPPAFTYRPAEFWLMTSLMVLSWIPFFMLYMKALSLFIRSVRGRAALVLLIMCVPIGSIIATGLLVRMMIP